MIIDDYTLDDEFLAFYKTAVGTMSDLVLINCARKLPELLKGLKQDKPNVDQLRHRVHAKLQLKSPPIPVMEILRAATLSDSLVDVFSEKALQLGLSALFEQFGRLPILAAMLIDGRESVRQLAHTELTKPHKIKANAKPNEEDTFKQRFKPLLDTLRPVLEGVPYEAPSPRATPAVVVPTLSREQKERDIVSSTPFRQLQKQSNSVVTQRDELLAQKNKLSTELASQTTRVNELDTQLMAMQMQLQQRIAQGVADGLNLRLAPWLNSSESLANWVPKSRNALERAQEILTRQAQQDKRYGIRSQVAEELAQARSLQSALKTALIESLRPLPQLADEIRVLSAHIEASETRLHQSSLQPQTSQLRELASTLQTLNDIDALQSEKKNQENTMLTEAWSLQMCQQAYALIDRRAMSIYMQYHTDPTETPPPVTPMQHLADCLLKAKPCRLLIDGHNLLHKIKPLIGADYFKQGQGPTAQARALLIDRIKAQTELHPLLQADIWFDGPDEQDWSETNNLRIWFSGGQGTNRADGRILESLQAEVYRGTHIKRLIVTEDRDLLQQAQASGAIGVSPLEMWALVV